MSEGRVLVVLSAEFLRQLDEVVELLGFGTREELIVAAVRRFVDKYAPSVVS